MMDIVYKGLDSVSFIGIGYGLHHLVNTFTEVHDA